jgi:hypothetical protein
VIQSDVGDGLRTAGQAGYPVLTGSTPVLKTGPAAATDRGGARSE